MSKSSEFFGEFKPHSKHKLLILKQYFYAWGHKLGMREGAGDAILYVDACAGRGADEVGNHGSPLIAARAAAIAQANVSERRSSPFRIQVVAIEENRAHYKALSTLLKPFGAGVRTVLGTLEEHIESLEREFPRTPTLYFIDPFGLEPLQGAVVRRALAGEQHEALLLFADQAALRHFGAISTVETRAEKRHRTAAATRAQELSLFAEHEDEEDARVAALADAADQSREALDLTHESAVRILNAAFEETAWLPAIDATPRLERRATFLRLYCDRLRSWGATYVLPIPIVNETGTHAYTLIHASKSPKAYVTMKEAVNYALANSPLDPSVAERMRDLIRCDLDAIVSAVSKRFASQRVRRDRGVSIRDAGTQSSAEEIQSVRTNNRLRLPGRSHRCRLRSSGPTRSGTR
jgi:three-Cys-motif partner protein